MSNSNNHNHTDCSGNEQIISYLYGEANPSERAAVETHLRNCSACADEFADFGMVRSSIQEWHDVEFANLEAHRFEVPMDYSDKQIAPSSYQSWLAKFSEIFARPVLATAALAVLVLFVGIVLVTQNLHRTDELAKGKDNQNSIETDSSPTIENAVQSPNQNSAAKVSEKYPSEQISPPVVKKPEYIQSRTTRSSQTPANDSAVKVSNNAAKNNSDNFESSRNVKASNKPMKKSPNVSKPSVPLYSIQAEDDEDKSVRLADLFDEIDSK